jgi:hypothetical protein
MGIHVTTNRELLGLKPAFMAIQRQETLDKYVWFCLSLAVISAACFVSPQPKLIIVPVIVSVFLVIQMIADSSVAGKEFESAAKPILVDELPDSFVGFYFEHAGFQDEISRVLREQNGKIFLHQMDCFETIFVDGQRLLIQERIDADDIRMEK